MVLRERTASIRSVLKGCSGRRQQAGLFFGEDLGDGAAVVAGPGPLVRDLVAPEQGLPIAFGQRGEGAARPERIADIADGAFHAAFLIAGAHLARPWREVIVRAQLDQSGIETGSDCRGAPARHFEIVVENHARLAGPVLKGMHMAAQKVLHGLIEEELQIQRSGVGQRHHEAG